MTATETDTLEDRAREALVALAQRHGLPAPAEVFWREDLNQLHAMLASDADVDVWAQAMLRTAKAEIVDHAVRSYGFYVERWMGVGVDLHVSHQKRRAQAPVTVAERVRHRNAQQYADEVRAERAAHPASLNAWAWAIGAIEAQAHIATADRDDIDPQRTLADIIDLCRAARGAS